MAKIELDCNFAECPHNCEFKCSIPGGVIINTSGRCMHASIVLDAHKTSADSGAGEYISQRAHVVRPLESGMLAGHDGPNAVLGTST